MLPNAWPLLAAAAVGALLAAVPLGWKHDAALAELQQQHTDRELTRLLQQRAESQRRQIAVEGIRRDAKEHADKVAVDAFAAGAASVSLQHAARATAARSACTAERGATTNAPADLLADVFGRLDQVAGELAAYADAAAAAGTTCERAADAMR